MSRSNYDKPFYVDIGTSIVAVRCASNHDMVYGRDHVVHPYAVKIAEKACDRMNQEVEIGRPRRNCDVGTEQEQARRFLQYCVKQDCEKACPFRDCKNSYECAFGWAKMPYEEGGAK